MQHKILIVEDDRDIRENTVELLGLSGYHVLSAGNGREGLELALQQKPDLILCDIRMPVMDGYLFLAYLKKDPAFSETKFIYFTASAEKKEIERGLNMGADDYIIKPFKVDELLIKIKDCLAEISHVE